MLFSVAVARVLVLPGPEKQEGVDCFVVSCSTKLDYDVRQLERRKEDAESWSVKPCLAGCRLGD